MPTTARPQQRYDHRLRNLVQGTRDVTIATGLGVPRSTARGWLGKAPKVVVSLDITDLRASELQQEILKLRRRVKKLTALLRLALALLRSSGFTLTYERLPDGRAKIRILRAVDRAREYVPLRALLRFLRLSPSRFSAWRRLQHACALDDRSSCPHTSPHRLTAPEVRAIRDMVTSLEYRHVPTGTLAVLAQRLGKVWASPSTWHHLVRKFGWRRPRLRVHPAKPKVGLRTTQANEMWHIDTTVIRLLDGTRAYLHAVIANFSRRILAWRVADMFAPVNTVAVLLEASRGTTPSETTPIVLADAGVENVNAQVDDLITTGLLRRVLAFTELKFSNSMIEAWWRSLKHQWLFLHSLDSVTTVRRLVAFYVDEHNRVLPHSAFRGQTPDEMYFGTRDAVPADLTSRAAAARRARVEANRSTACETCLSIDAAACYGVLTSFRPPGHTARARLEAMPGEQGTARRISRRAEPCPGSESLPVSSLCIANIPIPGESHADGCLPPERRRFRLTTLIKDIGQGETQTCRWRFQWAGETARENPRWGYQRIVGELKGLGIAVSATTVRKVLRGVGLWPASRRGGMAWREFVTHALSPAKIGSRQRSLTCAWVPAILQAMRAAVGTIRALGSALSVRRDLLLEILALRHQLGVLTRSDRRFRVSDRVVSRQWAELSNPRAHHAAR